MYGTELYHHANLHADRHKISVMGQKIDIFLTGDSLLGLLSHAIDY